MFAHQARVYGELERSRGRYRVVSTRIHPSPYATLVRYIQAEERGNTLLDSSADLPHLRALKAFIDRASSNGIRCEAVSGDDYGLTGTVAEIRTVRILNSRGKGGASWHGLEPFQRILRFGVRRGGGGAVRRIDSNSVWLNSSRSEPMARTPTLTKTRIANATRAQGRSVRARSGCRSAHAAAPSRSPWA
jgi:hypothetical protein